MARNEADGVKLVCQNRKARHEYHIEETWEAGLELRGTEVKSLRQGKGSLQEAYAQVKGGEAWLLQFHIPPYEQGNRFNVDPVRPRKLLLHRREIGKLAGAVSRQGYTLVPLRVYFRRGRAKVEIAVAKGKKLYDKREAMKERDTRRDLDRALRDRRV
ncbi:MAG TPA: SsrA-binding protein SmpB [Candidatus Sumerlaeota bacterium]|nr:MAG: SsrA-binding protein [candidate division BRC1 bacterium ADurb.BinA292]HOE96640.1 SsrA-binding protein SmpB [Candidatus Sumerlaeota bacterium]HOR27999.1 SsrA-binding protein SmpB [Candidatus Sumerlaeota bacterium]HPK01166.1 SsrA-binding protein SmpB [Candidatus Sumerlaeota bacterium]